VPFAAAAAPGVPGVRLLREAPGDGAGLLQGRRGGVVARIAVDALGADLGAGEVTAGAVLAAQSGTHCVLFGPRSQIEAALPDGGRAEVEIVDAPQGIANDDEPAKAVRSTPGASIVQAMRALGAGDADAVVSAGSTGAALAAGLLYAKRLPGVFRPAVAVSVPAPAGRVLLLDVGANVEVRPEHLVQFAFMGAAFSERLLGIERPRVGLLSVGEERGKGTPAVAEAHAKLAVSALDFAGNVEGNDIPEANVDVVVTDGFTGNVALKVMEGTARAVTGAVREAARSGPLATLGGLLLRPKLAGLRARLDPEEVGGAYLLGLRGLIVIAHGRSTRRAIANAIALARRGVEGDVVGKTAHALAEAGVLRGPEDDSGGAGSASVDADSVKITS
jgi:phosphate acyltransferase